MTPSLAPLPTNHPLPALLRRHLRVLLLGAPGSGKTTLATAAAARLAATGQPCRCLSADPGLPGVGPPGALGLGAWNGDHWRLEALVALCSLDASRFRLPLAEAAHRLAGEAPPGPLLIDAPGLVRGGGAAELLMALTIATDTRALLVIAPSDAPLPLADECRALGMPLVRLPPAPAARPPGKRQRRLHRSAAWNAWLADAIESTLLLDDLAVLGTPPPREAAAAWRGRQIGLLDARGDTLILGESVALEGDRLRLRAPPFEGRVHALVVRDAHRDDEDRLATAAPYRPIPAAPAHPELSVALPSTARPDNHRPVIRLEAATATLINGMFGDPLLHLRLHRQRRQLLFDLGDAGRLPARLAHRVGDVFISHAHFDHIGGFPWLLRSRIGAYPPCRLFGPPGLAGHVAAQVDGVLWDRVGDKAPRFEVAELHGERLERWSIVAGRQPRRLPDAPAPDGVLLAEPGFRVRAVTLDHGTPVLAFALEPGAHARVRREQLAARGVSPGPWLGELKRRVLAGEPEAPIVLPNGRMRPAAELASELLDVLPGQRLVYATDLADTPDNRTRLVTLARGAHTLVCEAPFLEREADQARDTGHLTARACGEIAAAAGVAQLVPFHFSRRHAGDTAALYAELDAACQPSRRAPPGDSAGAEG
ncbi:MBL fold metallo-hydrolase [Halomonas organivorans]|uniref:Ribonuclease BN (tRNA processing enzyme) n=1 Tax=Halomonas organivorans TaxID=257772 RepID=A0A7W5C2F8_9GAMM|nr:MBL fold metallo-hydrolase [Halomonas organivorans]MBB3142513.1 ribonuclease BN (tRNA processing enzyme) [Halomonas organivorans]